MNAENNWKASHNDVPKHNCGIQKRQKTQRKQFLEEAPDEERIPIIFAKENFEENVLCSNTNQRKYGI